MPVYNKLVRDKIPQLIEEDGKLCSIQKLNQLQYLQALKSKLEEEVSEYIHSGNDNDSIEELADIVEVIYSLAKIHGKSFKEVEEFREAKFKERGGFEDKVLLVEVFD